MNILLVGGSGIISGYVCNYALSAGHNVTILNRGKRKMNKNAVSIVADIRNETVQQISEKLGKNDFDVVVDFISYDVAQLKKSLEIFSNRCKQYIFISSATVYATDDVITENTPTTNNKWNYAVKKAQCEDYLKNFSSELNCAYTIVRPYVTYDVSRVPYQFSTIEYYTIINRCRNEKPLPIYGQNVKCTLTSSKDFAIAINGLFLNEKAFNQNFHITSDYSTTWENVGRIIFESVNVKPLFVDIPHELLKVSNSKLGFDANEILGDKGRNMVFDNSKIKSAVEGFKGDLSFENEIKETIVYYNTAPQKINYAWDARIDWLISSAIKRNNIKIKNYKLSLNAYTEKLSLNDKIKYLLNRYTLTYSLVRVLRKIKSKL